MADDAHYALTQPSAIAWRERPRGVPADVRLVESRPTRRGRSAASEPTAASSASSPRSRSRIADALFPEVVDGSPLQPWLRAIEADGELAGFVMTAERTAAHPETYLWRLLVDRRHQRRGIGHRAL